MYCCVYENVKCEKSLGNTTKSSNYVKQEDFSLNFSIVLEIDDDRSVRRQTPSAMCWPINAAIYLLKIESS